MDRMVVAARTPLAGLWLVLTLAGCSSGRIGSSGPPPVAGPAGTSAAHARVMEVPVMEALDRAVANGTRLRSGAPGPRYWQQWADYRLEAELNPISKRLTGKSAIRYYNRSPDTLATVYIHLLHNIFAPGSRHNTQIPWAVEGYKLSRVAAQGTALSVGGGDGPGYVVDGTIMLIRLPQPLPPGGTADLEFAYRIRIPPDGAPRGGPKAEDLRQLPDAAYRCRSAQGVLQGGVQTLRQAEAVQGPESQGFGSCAVELLELHPRALGGQRCGLESET
jgi:hypothetical protein